MLLSGPPLSGKRTLAPRLCAAHSLHHVHSGALLAAAARTDTPAGRSVRAWLLARTRRLARYAARARARVLAASAAAAAAATGAGDAEESTEDAEIVRLVTGGTTNASAAGSNRSSARPGGAGAHSSRHSAADAAAAARLAAAGHAGGGDHADSDDSDCDNDDDDDDDDWCDGAGSLGDAASAVAGAAFCPQDADLLSYLTGTGAELNPTAAAARTLALDSASATAQAHTTREYAAASAVLSALYAADIADAADAADAAVTAGGAAPPVLPTELLGVGAGLDAGLGSVLAPLRLLRRRPQHPPTALVWPLVKQALSSALARTAPRTAGAASPAEARHGVLLEGFPRCDEQAVLLAQFLAERDATVDAAVVLDVSEDEATKRARARVIEPTTDMSFSLAAVAAAGSTGSGEEAKQDMESPLLLSRVDDHPRAVRARFRDWHESACAVLHGTLPVLLPRCKIVTVDGAMKQEEVLAAVSVELETCRELSKAL
jgi:adenylate kinase family enzyme